MMIHPGKLSNLVLIDSHFIPNHCNSIPVLTQRHKSHSYTIWYTLSTLTHISCFLLLFIRICLHTFALAFGKRIVYSHLLSLSYVTIAQAIESFNHLNHSFSYSSIYFIFLSGAAAGAAIIMCWFITLRSVRTEFKIIKKR